MEICELIWSKDCNLHLEESTVLQKLAIEAQESTVSTNPNSHLLPSIEQCKSESPNYCSSFAFWDEIMLFLCYSKGKESKKDLDMCIYPS